MLFWKTVIRFDLDWGVSETKEHSFVEKSFNFTSCGVCKSMIKGGNALWCASCSFACHKNCKDDVIPSCGGVGLARLAFNVQKLSIKESHFYTDFANLLERDQFCIPRALGTISNDREIAATLLVSLFLM